MTAEESKGMARIVNESLIVYKHDEEGNSLTERVIHKIRDISLIFSY